MIILAAFIGTVTGSLTDSIFGLSFLNKDLFNGPLTIAEDFYLIEELSVRFTPGTLIGIAVAVWLLIRKGKS